MPEIMTCYACEQEPTQQCARCGRPYCEEHGAEYCNICLAPASGLPSFTLYRGSLLALLVGTALAVWLILQPSSSADSGVPRVIATPTAATSTARLATPGAPTTAAATAGTPAPGQTAVVATTGPSGASTPAVATTPGAGREYTVASGDTLSAICENQKPARLSVGECVEEVKRLNNLTSDTISVGDTLIIPQ